MASARVRRAGMQTTVQDLGRDAADVAAARSGAADAISLRVANRLVGNPDDAAGLEMTYVGADVAFDASAVVVASRGAVLERPGSPGVPVPAWRVIDIGPGDVLCIGACAPGARAYVGVAGGFDVPRVLGSRSTQVNAGIGGFHGRPLSVGDAVPIGAPTGRIARAMPAPIRKLLDANDQAGVLRIIADEHTLLTRGEFRVASASDRMGIRLERLGPVPAATPRGDLPTEPVEPGTIQATPSGELIILGVDGPTTGGYALVGCVCLRDLGALGQACPGDRLRLEPIGLDAAREAWRPLRAILETELPPCV